MMHLLLMFAVSLVAGGVGGAIAFGLMWALTAWRVTR